MAENYSLGLVIFPEDMYKFLKFCLENKADFKNSLSDRDFTTDDADLVLQKIFESLFFCLQVWNE